MSLINIHGEHLMRFILVLYALAMTVRARDDGQGDSRFSERRHSEEVPEHSLAPFSDPMDRADRGTLCAAARCIPRGSSPGWGVARS